MPGKVTLVGAGPGDPGLLTRKGLEALERADVVVYDRLVSPAILALMPEGAVKINVGKEASRHPVPQEQINRILLEQAQQDQHGNAPYESVDRTVNAFNQCHAYLSFFLKFLFTRGLEYRQPEKTIGAPQRIAALLSKAEMGRVRRGVSCQSVLLPESVALRLAPSAPV